jgi:hypothetical protein
MANLFSNLIPSYAQDVVGIFTQDFQQLFVEARPIKASIKEESKVMEHPVETGITITDHRIIQPIEIELSIIINSVDYADVYNTIRQNFLNATLLTVQTKVGVYTNQLIASLPHDEDPALYDTITIALRLKQVLFVTAVYGVLPRKASNSNTVNTGVQQAKPASSSVAANVMDYITGKAA